ncbi:uncharacterized protein BP01DRAFT_174298 [Aspergillus saccharolyticus JOP 1030-1]|uniref:Uncharacterized protein n=1 Tax=Aspergillus saccharolyticus JOP 1030-1 TaxID=1450539 RepID=A0A318ZKF9_9EURO|nr:hypothetical protein BP01DRAFT_174298 [Aspergillus saccharolyticus JOP 1030-1]PYH47996.1 hypothetical protein BP01DRAFT_174298 [Aspergillus saccharolyticus JOP 1030-1]
MDGAHRESCVSCLWCSSSLFLYEVPTPSLKFLPVNLIVLGFSLSFPFSLLFPTSSHRASLHLF